MTDRELLELAAKAAGIQYTISKNGTFLIAPYMNPLAKRSWNPLQDDGDALRLAVKLRMLVNVNTYFTDATDGSFVGCAETMHNDDPYAATRRAIVLAAAEIGRSMNDQ